MLDDIFNTAAVSKDAFEELTEAKPANTFKAKKESYWDKQDIQPAGIDVTTFKRTGKSFAIYVHPENDIPEEAANMITVLAKALMKEGYTFRHTGNSDNLMHNDIIGSEGAKVVSYLPWKKFNTNIPTPILPNELGYQIAIGIHKGFMKLPPAVRAILARDVNALTGTKASDPVDLVLAWTDGGAEALGTNADFKKIGNNAFILQVAKRANIPVFNVYNSDFIERFKALVNK